MKYLFILLLQLIVASLIAFGIATVLYAVSFLIHLLTNEAAFFFASAFILGLCIAGIYYCLDMAEDIVNVYFTAKA